MPRSPNFIVRFRSEDDKADPQMPEQPSSTSAQEPNQEPELSRAQLLLDRDTRADRPGVTEDDERKNRQYVPAIRVRQSAAGSP